MNNRGSSLFTDRAFNSLKDKILAWSIKQDDGCVVYMRAKTNGYGVIRWKDSTHTTHTAIYRELVGDIPQGMELHHKCRNRACVNIDHLELISHFAHSSKSGASKSEVTHCKYGHPLSGDNLRVRERKGLYLERVCIQCTKDRALKNYYKNKL